MSGSQLAGMDLWVRWFESVLIEKGYMGRSWYKSAPYRSRAVRDPRGVLAEFGVTLDAETEIRVWDSMAEVR